MASGWLSLLRSLGKAFAGVLDAEAKALKGDLRVSARSLAVAVGLLAVAAFSLFWAIGAAALVVFEVLGLWLSDWLAALIVFALWMLAGLAIAAVGRWRLRQLESPAETVRRRVRNHKDWWQEQLLLEPGERTSPRLPAELASEQSEADDS